MWALRRASNPIKNSTLGRGIACTHAAKSESPIIYAADSGFMIKSPSILDTSSPSLKRAFSKEDSSSRLFVAKCGFSSQAGASNSKDEDELEDEFSELEIPLSSNAVSEFNDDSDNELSSESELSDGIVDEVSPENDLDLIENQVDAEKISSRKAQSILFKAISADLSRSIADILDKWVEEGNDLSHNEIWLAFINLRKLTMFGKALQLSEWLEKHDQYEFVEKDYASRVDLIARVRGSAAAEAYVEKIPETFRGEVVYRTLLANSIHGSDPSKAEEIFNKMRDLKFPVTAFACNQLLLLYKRINKKKIADVLSLMEKEEVKPTHFTYSILIDIKGQSNDLQGMDVVVETMKGEGIEPDSITQAMMAKHCIAGGEKDKAEALLKEIEGGNLKKHRVAIQLVLPLYAELGKAEEVRRVWKACESRPTSDEFLAAIEAWGKLKEIEEAEGVFDQMHKTWNKLSAKQYDKLLKVYVENKMLSKGKDLVKRMAESGCPVMSQQWDSIVKLYVASGEVEKADSFLNNVAQKYTMKPMFLSLSTIMVEYAKRGDVHNTEKILHRMRQFGYTARYRQFECLLQAYVNARVPAYGMRQRLQGDGIFPTKSLTTLLSQSDPFKRTPMLDLSD